MKKRSLQAYIAVGVTIAFFLLFFGNLFSIFPKIFVFDFFRSNINQSNYAVSMNFTSHNNKNSSTPENRLDGGVTLFDLQEGTGTLATEGSTVSVGYVGIYIDAETRKEVQFDANTDRNSPFTFTIGAQQVVPGFEAGITGMREGGVRVIILNPEVAYGNRQVGNIPPNTTLQFTVELYEVK